MDLLNLAEQAVLWWMCYSCIGWVWETGLNLVLKHKWVDRGALNGPICPIYGNGALLVILLLHDVTNPVALFLGSGVIACTLEYVVSWQYERLFRIRLWDYTDKPFNINGRVYLNGFLAFGAGATLIKLVVQPWLAHLTAAMPQPWLHIAAWGLLAVAFVDWLISTMGMADMDNRLARLGEDVKAGRLEAIDKANSDMAEANVRMEQRLVQAQRSARDRLDQARDRIDDTILDIRAVGRKGEVAALDRLTREHVRRALSRQQIRLLRAFPSLRSSARRELTDRIHKLLER